MTIPVSVKKYATTVDPYQKVLLTPNPLTEEESEVEEVEGTGERQEQVETSEEEKMERKEDTSEEEQVEREEREKEETK